VALWFLDRHLRRTRSEWLSTYRRCLLLLPLLIVGMVWQLSGTPSLADDNGLAWRITQHAGGLSGAPLLTRTRGAVRRMRALVGERLAIIASGGIGSGGDAAALIGAGADLVQLWTGLVYAGPGLIGEATKATEAPSGG